MLYTYIYMYMYECIRIYIYIYIDIYAPRRARQQLCRLCDNLPRHSAWSVYIHGHMYMNIYVYIFLGKAVFKRPLSPTISFLPCQIEGPLFDTGIFCGAPLAAARGWHQVARHWHNSNGIISASSSLDGYCSTVQGLLDWFEVDLGFTELLFIQIDVCVDGIISARSASLLAPDSVAAIGNECLRSLASSPSLCNH